MSQVQERTRQIPQFLLSGTPDFPVTKDLVGSPEFNFLLTKPIEIADEAHMIVEQGQLHPLLTPFIQIDINGGVMGQQAEIDGWGNMKSHLITTQQFVRATAQIVRLPFTDNLIVQASALIHDCDTRIHKQKLPLTRVINNGNTTLKVDEYSLFESEMDDRGPSEVNGLECIDPQILHVAGVTHAKWIDPANWNIQRKIMRLADSCVGSSRDSNGGYLRDTFCYPEGRIDNLKKNKPTFDRLGMNIYGMPTFDMLAGINQMAERDLRVIAEHKNPVLLWCYFYDNPQNRFVDLIHDVMTQKIILSDQPGVLH